MGEAAFPMLRGRLGIAVMVLVVAAMIQVPMGPSFRVLIVVAPSSMVVLAKCAVKRHVQRGHEVEAQEPQHEGNPGSPAPAGIVRIRRFHARRTLVAFRSSINGVEAA